MRNLRSFRKIVMILLPLLTIVLQASLGGPLISWTTLIACCLAPVFGYFISPPIYKLFIAPKSDQ